jgi:glycine/D-amino acid oxidase-like deaminating enzyme
MNRRDFLATLAGAAALAGCDASPRSLPPGGLLGPSLDLGHRLKARDFPAPTRTLRTGVLIIGGGIAGLSAGWKLQKAGFGDFLLLEMEKAAGGNTSHGANAVSAYPWGAHYIPLPRPEARLVRELLADLGVLQGDPHALVPRYDERHLVHAPQERLYRYGTWQEGLLPQIGIANRDREQYRRFHDRIQVLRERRDRQGRPAFALPMELGSTDRDRVRLDALTMHDWLLAEGLDSDPLHWYVNYACRDDYGTDYRRVSAWAGLHYFAARGGQAQDAEAGTVLTWPEGNGWVAKKMAAMLESHLRPRSVVFRLAEVSRHLEADIYDAGRNESYRIRADQIIWAGPLFLLPFVLENMAPDWRAAVAGLSYAPWLVANLTLDQVPAEQGGAPPAWDSVLYDSPGVGYVVANHQHLRRHAGGQVWTYYRPLAELDPAAARRTLLEGTRESWCGQILDDLERPHPDIRERVIRLDAWRWGHAMVRPVPGLISGQARASLTRSSGRLHLAHSDLSGLSLFEEAQYRGVVAAERVLRAIA